jgi:hypothetical protein
MTNDEIRMTKWCRAIVSEFVIRASTFVRISGFGLRISPPTPGRKSTSADGLKNRDFRCFLADIPAGGGTIGLVRPTRAFGTPGGK